MIKVASLLSASRLICDQSKDLLKGSKRDRVKPNSIIATSRYIASRSTYARAKVAEISFISRRFAN